MAPRVCHPGAVRKARPRMKGPFVLTPGALMIHVFVLLFAGMGAPFKAEAAEVVEIWPGNAPEESGKLGPERVVMSPKLDHKQVEVTESTRMITDVTRPTLT